MWYFFFYGIFSYLFNMIRICDNSCCLFIYNWRNCSLNFIINSIFKSFQFLYEKVIWISYFYYNVNKFAIFFHENLSFNMHDDFIAINQSYQNIIYNIWKYIIDINLNIYYKIMNMNEYHFISFIENIFMIIFLINLMKERYLISRFSQ